MADILRLYCVETPDGVYIKSDGNYRTETMFQMLFDGAKPDTTFLDQWGKLSAMPQRVTKYVHQPDINYRYELVDPAMVSDKIPAILTREEVEYYVEDYESCWRSKQYKHLQSLYKEASDKQPNKLVDQEFEITAHIKTDVIRQMKDLSIPAYQNDIWVDRKDYVITNNNVTYQLLDQLRFPDIILPMLPCKLTFKQSYDIVRAFVRDNHNPKYAIITSDYDFCFTVKKRIELAAQEAYQVDVSRTKKPRYETRYRKSRDIEIFEMTSVEKAYPGYTPIKGFEGKDRDDLQANIDKFCDDLIKIINEPLVDCPHCNGCGVVIDKIKGGVK